MPQGRYSIVEVDLPGHGPEPSGVLLQDEENARLYLRFRRDWQEWAGDEAEVLELLADDLERKADSRDLGAEGLFAYLETSQSNLIRLTDRQAVEVDDFERGLNRLYRRHVKSNVIQFATHIPFWSLEVAAGPFRANAAASEKGWLEAPEGLRVNKDMFAATIFGRSMEPEIPDGSLCVFRRFVAGSRTGLKVLVEDREGSGDQRYTVKRYRSDNKGSRKRVYLESLNPEFPAWELEPDEERYAVIAEYIRVIE